MHTTDAFSFCPKCKSDLKSRNNKLVKCTECDFHLYLNPAPTVALLTKNENNEILIVRRKIDPGKGMLDLPGGFVEIGETFEECLIREMREELNVGLSNIRYLTSTVDDYLFHNINYHTICNNFSADLDNYNVKPHDDIDEIVFYKYEDIPWDKFAFPGQVDFLRETLSGSGHSG